MPTAAIVVANEANLIGLDTVDFDGAEVADRQSRSRGRKSNREGGRASVNLMMFMSSPYGRANLGGA